MARHIAAWTETPAHPSPDKLVQYVSIVSERDTVGVTVRNDKGESVTAIMPFSSFLALVDDCNVVAFNHRRRRKR